MGDLTIGRRISRTAVLARDGCRRSVTVPFPSFLVRIDRPCHRRRLTIFQTGSRQPMTRRITISALSLFLYASWSGAALAQSATVYNGQVHTSSPTVSAVEGVPSQGEDAQQRCRRPPPGNRPPPPPRGGDEGPPPPPDGDDRHGPPPEPGGNVSHRHGCRPAPPPPDGGPEER